MKFNRLRLTCYTILFIIVTLACASVEPAAPNSELYPTLPASPPAAVTPAIMEMAPPLTATPVPPTPTPRPVTGKIISAEYVESFSIDDINALSQKFYPLDNFVPAKYGVETYRIWFQTIDDQGNIIETRADIYFPQVSSPIQFPIFAYGSGTTGVGNNCATLDEQLHKRDWGTYRTHLASYASHGFVTMLSNWQGFDIPDRTHPYFIAELEGYVMLDGIRALYNFFANPPTGNILAQPGYQIFFGGYSQGAHGAFAANYMAATYAPEIEPLVKGIIGHASAPDVEGLIYDSPRYSPYVVYAYRNFYGPDLIDPAEVFLPKWLPNLEESVTSKCIDEVFKFYPNVAEEIYQPAFMEALYNDQLADKFPAFNEKLDANNSGNLLDLNVPAIILHGSADPIVTVETNERFVAKMCNSGKNVTYRLYEGIHHFQTRQHSFVDTLTWMQQILAGHTPESECSAFFLSKLEE